MESIPLEILKTNILSLLATRTQIYLALTCKDLKEKVEKSYLSHVKSRLAELFDPPQYELIKYLTDNFCICGGSVVYGLNPFVLKETVGDIDVICGNKRKMLEALSVVRRTCNVTAFERVSSASYSGVCDGDEFGAVSIVNVSLEGNEVKLQFILQEYTNILDIVQNYDLDYVQCGIDKGMIFRTESCARSHRERQVFEAYQIPNAKRMRKATLKGFKAPIFGVLKEIKLSPLDFDLKENDLSWFRPKPAIGIIDLTKLWCDSALKGGPVKMPTGSTIEVFEILCRINAGSHGGEFGDNMLLIDSPIISFEADVDFIDSSPWSPGGIQIKPILIGPQSIKYAKVDNLGTILKTGRQTVIGQFRMSYYYGKSNISLKILNIGSNLNYDLIQPVRMNFPIQTDF